MLIIQRATNAPVMKPNNNWSDSAFEFEIYRKESGKILATHGATGYPISDRRKFRRECEEIFLYTDGDIT